MVTKRRGRRGMTGVTKRLEKCQKGQKGGAKCASGAVSVMRLRVYIKNIVAKKGGFLPVIRINKEEKMEIRVNKVEDKVEFETSNGTFYIPIEEGEEVEVFAGNDIQVNVWRGETDTDDTDYTDEKPKFEVVGKVYDDRVEIKLVENGKVVKERTYEGAMAELVKKMSYLNMIF